MTGWSGRRHTATASSSDITTTITTAEDLISTPHHPHGLLTPLTNRGRWGRGVLGGLPVDAVGPQDDRGAERRTSSRARARCFASWNKRRPGPSHDRVGGRATAGIAATEEGVAARTEEGRGAVGTRENRPCPDPGVVDSASPPCWHDRDGPPGEATGNLAAGVVAGAVGIDGAPVGVAEHAGGPRRCRPACRGPRSGRPQSSQPAEPRAVRAPTRSPRPRPTAAAAGLMALRGRTEK